MKMPSLGVIRLAVLNGLSAACILDDCHFDTTWQRNTNELLLLKVKT